MIKLMYETPVSWAEIVVDAMDEFLPDHAAAEKKASGMAMGMVSHYPDRPELVLAMIDLAIEELNHYRAVVKLMNERGLCLLPDEKDPYVNRLRAYLSVTARSTIFWIDCWLAELSRHAVRNDLGWLPMPCHPAGCNDFTVLSRNLKKGTGNCSCNLQSSILIRQKHVHD